MKAKIILAIMWISICLCERQQRSTVLTDESKRVLEQFDFSNFDKQEALNYIDRQRFENQIRGKRSHSRIKKEQNDEDENPSDEEPEPNEQKKDEENNESYNFDSKPEMFENYPPDPRETVSESPVEPITTTTAKSKKAHRSKKKHRSKVEEESDEDEEGETYRPRKKKKKKKKKKKRHYWDNWTEWSPCSVTCGRGRRIRWRKCIVKNCTTGDLEMGEKTCQLPACNLLTKLLGL